MDVALYLVCQRYDLLLLKSLARSISFKMAMMHACPWFTFEAYVTKMTIYICHGLPNVCLCGCLTFQNPGKHVLLVNVESRFCFNINVHECVCVFLSLSIYIQNYCSVAGYRITYSVATLSYDNYHANLRDYSNSLLSDLL